MTDKRTNDAYLTSARLRALLLEHFKTEPLDTLATALAYELASVVATAAPTKGQAVSVLVHFTQKGIEQIRAFGVGRPHP